VQTGNSNFGAVQAVRTTLQMVAVISSGTWVPICQPIFRRISKAGKSSRYRVSHNT